MITWLLNSISVLRFYKLLWRKRSFAYASACEKRIKFERPVLQQWITFWSISVIWEVLMDRSHWSSQSFDCWLDLHSIPQCVGLLNEQTSEEKLPKSCEHQSNPEVNSSNNFIIFPKIHILFPESFRQEEKYNTFSSNSELNNSSYLWKSSTKPTIWYCVSCSGIYCKCMQI